MKRTGRACLQAGDLVLLETYYHLGTLSIHIPSLEHVLNGIQLALEALDAPGGCFLPPQRPYQCRLASLQGSLSAELGLEVERCCFTGTVCWQ